MRIIKIQRLFVYVMRGYVQTATRRWYGVHTGVYIYMNVYRQVRLYLRTFERTHTPFTVHVQAYVRFY